MITPSVIIGVKVLSKAQFYAEKCLSVLSECWRLGSEKLYVNSKAIGEYDPLVQLSVFVVGCDEKIVGMMGARTGKELRNKQKRRDFGDI